jgi:hypothetical protein
LICSEGPETPAELRGSTARHATGRTVTNHFDPCGHDNGEQTMCADAKTSSSNAPVPDFETVGFGGAGGAQSNALTQAHAALGDVRALSLSGCVGASYNAGTNQICFSIPIYGQLCVTSPISIPVSASIKACFQTCGSIFPHGVQVSIYLNGSSTPIYSGTVVGFC